MRIAEEPITDGSGQKKYKKGQYREHIAPGKAPFDERVEGLALYPPLGGQCKRKEAYSA